MFLYWPKLKSSCKQTISTILKQYDNKSKRHVEKLLQWEKTLTKKSKPICDLLKRSLIKIEAQSIVGKTNEYPQTGQFTIIKNKVYLTD